MFDLRRSVAVCAVLVAILAFSPFAPAQAVVGGREATATSFPWLAALRSPLHPDRPGGNFCAGALIAPDQVLTAGHCAIVGGLIPQLIAATFGSSDLRAGDGITVGIKALRLHPRFFATPFGPDTAFHNDVAIMTLEHPLSLPLATLGAPHGATAAVAGWGATTDTGDISNSQLHTATVPLDDSACGNYGPAFDATNMLCAGSTSTDTGDYDSGGPLLVDGKIVGVTSWGNGSARPGFPGIYARVPDLNF